MLCPEGHHKLVLHDGDLVCGKCGFVEKTEAETYVNERQTTMESHSPINYGMLIRIGSQHDYISPTNTGLCFKLANPATKDCDGKRIKSQQSDGYVTGQVADKGSVAYTLYDLFEEEREKDPNLLWPDFKKRLAREAEANGEELEEGKIRAKKPITDDATFRNAKQDLRELEVKFSLNRDAVKAIDDQLIRFYQEWLSYSRAIIAIAITDIIAANPGLGIERHKIIDGINNSTYIQEYLRKELVSIGAHVRDRIKGAINVCETGLKIPAR